MIKNKNNGFSLLELIIILVIAAIITAVTIPSFKLFLVKSEDQVAESELLRAINFAKSEAVLQNAKIILSKKETWQEGYVVLNNNTILYEHEYEFQHHANNILHWRSAIKNHDYLEFSPSGLSGMGNGTFWYCHHGELNPVWAIVLNRIGRARSELPNSKGEIVDSEGKVLVC